MFTLELELQLTATIEYCTLHVVNFSNDLCLCFSAGLVSGNGPAWKEQRRFALSVLRDFGMGKTLIEEKIQEEADSLAMELDKHINKDLDLHNPMGVAVSNIICSVVFGERYAYEDKEFQNYLSMLNFMTMNSRGAVLAVDVFPFLQYIPGEFFSLFT